MEIQIQVFTYATTPSLVGSDVLTGILSRTVGEDVGNYAIGSTLANTNYNITFVSADLTITQKAITITADAKTKVYGDSDPIFTYATTPSLVGSDVLTGILSRTVGEDVGNYAIGSTLANTNYNITFVSADLTITQKAITITADAKTKVYGDSDPIFTYATTPSLVGSDVLTGILSRTVGEDVGNYAIGSTLANANYNITFVSADLTITQKAITITADAKTKVYGDSDPIFTYATTPSLVGSDVLTGILSRTVGEDVGNYAIGSTLANTNYNITFVSADLTITQKAITITADAKTKVYGDSDPSLTYTATPSLVGSDVLTGSLSRTVGEDVGNYAIGSTLANTNYNITFVSADLTITQKAITITADAKTKVYGDSDPIFTYATTPSLVGSDVLTGILSRTVGEDVGNYAIGSTLANTNYNITFVSADLTITQKAITITADAKTKVYGDSDPIFTYAAAPSLVGSDVLTGILSRTVGEDVGNYAIGSTLANTNYNITFVSADLTITQKAITITADAKTKVYGDSDPIFTYATTPSLVGSDVLTGILSRTVGEDVGNYAIGSTLANTNYNITFVSADLTITQKAITITADAKTKVYGDSDPIFTYATTPSLVGSDILTGILSRTVGEDVGNYAIGSTLANTNYNITFVSADLTITQKAITITADAKTKVYGDSDPIFTYATTPSLVGSDVLTGILSRTVGEDVGNYAIGSTLANTNYNITFVSADLTITQKAITITADAKTKVYGDADPSLTYTATPSLVGSDVLTGILSRTVGEDVGNYAIGSTLANTNYNITFVSADLTITQKAITITADAKTKVYGDSDPSLTYTVAPSLVGSDVLTGILSRTVGEDVGNYAIGSTLANTNYNITFVSADLTITQKAITITADAKTKVYGDSDPSLTYTATPSLVGSDVLTGILSRTVGEDVGNYAIGSTLANTNYNITFVSADLTITQKAITITADAKTKVYGDSDPIFTYATTPSLVGSDILTGILSRTVGEDVGNYAIGSTLANTNYNITFVSADLTITQKAITITADAKTKVYGDADPSLTYTVAPSLVGSDVLTGILSRTVGEDVGNYAIGSTLANTNYNITFVSADLTITQKAITITADAKTKVYGDSDPSLTYTVAPSLVGSDVLTGILSRTVGEDVGNYAIGSTLANTNYNITFVSADLTITQKAITITADAKTKVYGDSDPIFTYATTPSLVGSDILTGILSRTVGEDVGNYAIGSTLANTNYNITFVSADLTITQASQTIMFGPLSHTTSDVFNLSATASSGLTVTYISSDTSIATISGDVITILSAGSVTITASQAGDINFSAAADVSQFLNITTLNISEGVFNTRKVFMYPNPSKNNIKISLGIEQAEVTIFDINGKQIKAYNNYNSDNEIDISKLKIGVYLIRIKNENTVVTKRFVKIK